MPYSIIFKDEMGVSEIKPIACDNPRSVFGLEDRSIEVKAKKLASHLTKRFPGLECSVTHYTDFNYHR